MNPLVVIPTFNEINNLEAIVRAIFDQGVPGLSVLVVDDESPDGTGALADRMAQAQPGRVNVLHRAGKRGLGRAYVDGFRWALAHGADPIVQMDADFSHSPSYLPVFMDHVARHDVVIGSRWANGGDVDKRWGLNRYLLSSGANLYARTILSIRTHDATAGFKCWRASALEAIDVDRIVSDGYIFQVEMTYVAERLGLSVVEVPIFFEVRHTGKSKMSLAVKLEAMWRVFQVGQRHRDIRAAIPAPLTRASSKAEG
jgi:dolichol-phosphate mannosyltransferase